MRIGLILMAIVLIVFGWGAYKEKEQKQQINTIINKQDEVNQIEVKDQRIDKVIFSTKNNSSLDFLEKHYTILTRKLFTAFSCSHYIKEYALLYILTFHHNGLLLFPLHNYNFH